ncbi:hypothetical protein DY000_02031990 [Brassica cretica]|uniref:Uncharacterized protein n=1 Tax=Brassica cretica TaxID=69181 RepID=A0ABQ7DRK8_BRACR|nr:hypothetical protein DY000_02031990 [Brassica cretica]
MPSTCLALWENLSRRNPTSTSRGDRSGCWWCFFWSFNEMVRSVCRRGSDGVWRLGFALSSGSSSCDFWRSLLFVEWSVLPSWSQAWCLFLSPRRVFAQGRRWCRRRVHKDACWSCGQGLFVVMRVCFQEVPTSYVVYGRPVLFEVQSYMLLEAIVLSSSCLRLGKFSVVFFTVCYLLLLKCSSLVLHIQSRYKFWGDNQDLATLAMSRGVRHPRR